MSIKRQLLQKVVNHMWQGELVDEIKELLAQPEQDNIQYLLDQVARLTAENAMLKEKWSTPKPESEQQPEAWIIVNKETGYRTQVSDLTPFLYNREIFEVIPLYTAPPKREPLSEDKLDVLAEANITDEGIAGYYLGFRDAEKYHGIGGGE
jgi:hypothetical protein